ncbi:nucleoid-associated protein [Alkaliphilus transvaalensis]|uniref:nucleoid-associated protein n=1 Tax=Alkaliphilus transvaalensis TaxID=114628 RepID=UPI000479218F|nr:nucleoid-associated protein [Alkaliphilus transvaalensis]
MEQEIKIKKAIMHILDANVGMPILSNVVHPSTEDIHEFLENHITKMLKDQNLKPATFNREENPVVGYIEELAAEEHTFIHYTGEMAKQIYNIMIKNVDIPSADLVFTIFEWEQQPYLAILKFNYRYSYIHYTEDSEEGRMNSIIKQKTALPNDSQKVDEGAIINLETFHIQLIEKEYEINGEKQFYFSKLFLKCNNRQSDLQKAKSFKKATEIFNKKFCNQDIQISDEFGKEILKSIDESGNIDIPKITEKVFQDNQEMKDIYMEHIEKAGFVEEHVELKEEVVRKVFNKRKIKTDNGIEINLSLEQENDNLELVNNYDGTITIIIKNINSISYK